MKSLLASARAWINPKKKDVPREILIENVIPLAPPLATPVVSVDFGVLHTGAELKISIRGAKAYGTCPHCESIWNVRERMSHPKFRQNRGPKNLTCPSCDRHVGLPSSMDARKLS